MERMNEENEQIGDELPGLEQEIIQLEEQIAKERLRTRVCDAYRAVNVDGSVSLFSSA